MFQVSPGVNVSEIDLSTGIPAVSSNEGALAGVFRWGPVGQRMLVTSETDLVNKTGKPTNFNPETWFTASNFLQYANQLYLVRVSTGTSAMAVFTGSTAPNAATQTVNNSDIYNAGGVPFSANVGYVAKYPGDLGNSLRVSVCDSANAYSKTVQLVANADIAPTSNLSISVGNNVATVSIGFAANGTQSTANAQAYAVRTAIQPGDLIQVGNSNIGTQYLKVASVGTVTGNSTISQFQINFAQPYRLYSDWSSNVVNRYWEFFGNVDRAPSTSAYVDNFGNSSAVDEIHVVVVDDGGKFTGVPGSILEVFPSLSRATDAKGDDGSSIYYKNVINNKSNYIWWANDRTGAPTANAAVVTSATTDTPLSVVFQGGTDGDDETTIALSKLAQGYDLLKAADEFDVSFIMTGKARATDGSTLANYIFDNVSEYRKDCIAFVSPPKEAVVNNVGRETESIVGFSNLLRSTSYGFMDSGYKYMYDKYNDIYRWVPLNGDIAGICARSDETNDAWWSPAGYNRGMVKNAVKLAFNPNGAQRDVLYKSSVNAVINKPGEGALLYGDKTLLKTASSFSRINVRRLFIVIEKSIASDAGRMLFEFNDDFTRAQFRNRIVPFLRDVQGRRGITDFLVVSDETNNTAEVIDREEFVGDIYIKPNRAINSIQLNFVAVRTGVQFNEIVGQF